MLRGVMTPAMVGVMTPTKRFNLADILARALYSEYCNHRDGFAAWHDLPEDAKNQWRRVAAYVERLMDEDGVQS